jgi:protein involved in temperature-dependent protein secretion
VKFARHETQLESDLRERVMDRRLRVVQYSSGESTHWARDVQDRLMNVLEILSPRPLTFDLIQHR